MHALKKRIESLEERQEGGLVLMAISWLPGGGRETATYGGVTYTQAADESQEEFRDRLGKALQHGKQRFVWVSELDARL
jgi:hypothetical protein